MCYPVAAGMKSDDFSSRPDKSDFCPYGEISKTGSNTCAVCSAGSTCSSQNLDPDTCDAARFQNADGEFSCYPILTTGGIYAKYDSNGDLTFDSDITHVDINVNQINDGAIGFTGMATTSTFDCSKGMECLFPFIQDWYQCPAGTYSEDSSRHCQPCPSGKYCPKREDDSYNVRDGYFSPINVHIELVSPAGWESHNSVTSLLAPCKDGYYSNDNTRTCQ